MSARDREAPEGEVRKWSHANRPTKKGNGATGGRIRGKGECTREGNGEIEGGEGGALRNGRKVPDGQSN